MPDEWRWIEFTVERITPFEGDVLIAGRVLTGPIRLGDVFEEVFQVEHQRVDEAFDGSSRKSLRAMEARVMGIRAYRTELDEIHGGMTCELRLTGASPADFALKTVLVGEMLRPQ
ncbi:hypothetical protein OV208_16185 [Corallococcus sp. bb12-1]|uniref:hypothetical protein n=1 Tax=Corallococcus sp. bb12-1 TaxID=2996784 RepID=UPI002271202A|nr:hypothetical protein [Corallococcus sp. bb12-1]MCY1042860.1 hypothetical protein [Corallococcus sp. bb12-1]